MPLLNYQLSSVFRSINVSVFRQTAGPSEGGDRKEATMGSLSGI